eukprot:m.212436 g.212436  ORF g.212436 m.212436 type:complete len:56 (-) comp22150_c8_seq2:30-197(-)
MRRNLSRAAEPLELGLSGSALWSSTRRTRGSSGDVASMRCTTSPSIICRRKCDNG